MKKSITILLSFALLLSLTVTACGSSKPSVSDDTADSLQQEDDSMNNAAEENQNSSVEIKQSPDKYTWYIKNYVGKNCASLGYTAISGERYDKYGVGLLELVFVASDGTYVDIQSDDTLKEYTVIGQNLTPNTELKLEFEKDSNGNEYDNLVSSQSYEEIVLSVKKVGTQEEGFELTAIDPSPDKYTWYIADYVGRNLASCGYTSLGGDLVAKYGASVVKFIIIADDGSFIDPNDTELLKNYAVTAQNIEPNTELKLVFLKDSDGEEYSNLVESQNIEEIELSVKRVSDEYQSSASETNDTEDGEDEADGAESASDNQLVDGMRPDFKKTMDSYEAFYEEYCDFMKKYSDNPSDLTLLSKYSDMLVKAEEMNEAFEKWDEDDLNSEELKYYLDVNNRVMKMMVDVTD